MMRSSRLDFVGPEFLESRYVCVEWKIDEVFVVLETSTKLFSTAFTTYILHMCHKT